jgi:hypothetical protein
MIGAHFPDVACGICELVVVLLEQGSALEHWSEGEFFEGLVSRVEAAMGMTAFMLVVCVSVYLSLQYWTKNYTVPAVVLVLSGGVILSMLPPVVARIGWIIVLLAGSIGLFGLLWAVIR